MTPRVLIRDGNVVFPNRTVQTNLLLEAGKIIAVDASRNSSASHIIEAAGLTVLPGIVDDQVHFREPGATHKEDLRSGSTACAAGGVTTYLEMPNTSPPATSVEALQWKYDRAAQISRVNYGFYIGANGSNVDQLRRATFAPGIKIFIGSSTGELLVDSQDALEQIFAETSLPLCAHCEDESTVRANREAVEQSRAAQGQSLTIDDHSRIRNVEAAVIATRRAIDLAVRHQHRFHVLHVSTAAELPLIAGQAPWITAEACPHHLLFSTDDYSRLGSLVQMNPSVKPPENPPQLWQALLDGVIQVIATDHAPHTLEEKSKPYPNSPSGLPAVENSLALMLDQFNRGQCSLTQIAHWMSDAPARVWGLVGKGRIDVGYDADLVLVDLSERRQIDNAQQHTKSRWSPWHGSTLQGWPVETLVGGRTVYLNRPGASIASLFRDEVLGQAVRCDHARGGYWATADGIGI
jgi:dihydroorotase